MADKGSKSEKHGYFLLKKETFVYYFPGKRRGQHFFQGNGTGNRILA